jgi:LacI family transcriptional regulator
VRTLRAHRVDGLIVATSGGYEEIGVPAVFFDNMPTEIGAGAVLMENDAGVRLLVEHLAWHHGHERIAYVGPPDAGYAGAPFVHLAASERLDGFRAAMGRCRLPLPPEYVRTSDLALSEVVARSATAELLRLDSPPTAIVAGADTLAIGALKGLRDEGRRSPDDVAFVSFDEPAYADLLDPPVSSLDRHDRELGSRAAELLLATLRSGDGGGLEPRIHRVPMQLLRRRSCGCGA